MADRTCSMTERFMAKVEYRDGPMWTPCLIWTGALSDGYGYFGVDGKMVRVHRWAYENWVGPIPAGLELDHVCRVPACANPLHLEPVTHAENMRRSEVGQYQQDPNWQGRTPKTHCPHGHECEAKRANLRAQGILPKDPDLRRSSRVRTRQMTDEERARMKP